MDEFVNGFSYSKNLNLNLSSSQGTLMSSPTTCQEFILARNDQYSQWTSQCTYLQSWSNPRRIGRHSTIFIRWQRLRWPLKKKEQNFNNKSSTLLINHHITLQARTWRCSLSFFSPMWMPINHQWSTCRRCRRELSRWNYNKEDPTSKTLVSNSK